MKIPFSKLSINNSDINNVKKSILSGWLAHGKYSQIFEKEFKNFTKSKYSSLVSSCTAGLHLTCLALSINYNDEVIVPAQTHTATAHAVELTGAKAVFVDTEPITANIDTSLIEKKITKKTKAIICVHMAGAPCNMKKLLQISKKYNLYLIEDCAHAIGTKYNNIHAGNFGIAGVFSFYPTKQITMGEGGIVISKNKNFINKINRLKAFGINSLPQNRKLPGKYDVNSLGLNYRMTDFQAALGCGQIQRYFSNLESRKKKALLYNKLFSKIDGISFLPFSESNSYFIYPIILDKKINRDKLLNNLKKFKVGVSIHYATPVPLMKYYKVKYSYNRYHFTESIKYSKSTISLPVYPSLKKNEIIYITESIKKSI